MSRRRKEVYIEVFRAVQDRLVNPSVEMATADFEAGAWQAICEVFPHASLKGCAFHWSKAVWSHVQQLGLSTTFRQREGAHSFIKQLLALPFLPWNHVEDVFRVMEERAPATHAVRQGPVDPKSSFPHPLLDCLPVRHQNEQRRRRLAPQNEL
eukprot:XP_011439145.1 PREDICTED: uncharacterized protein LOC105336498 [Crassostrea gigas]